MKDKNLKILCTVDKNTFMSSLAGEVGAHRKYGFLHSHLKTPTIIGLFLSKS
jgi:hypothetical protein